MLKSAFLVLLLIWACYARETKQDSIQKAKDIRFLLEASGSEKLAMQLVSNLLSSLRNLSDKIPDSLWDEIKNKMIVKDDLYNLMVPMYEKHFSHKEVKEIMEFYRSPVGLKLMKAMPLITEEAMIAGERWGQIVTDKIFKELRDKGYKLKIK